MPGPAAGAACGAAPGAAGPASAAAELGSTGAAGRGGLAQRVTLMQEVSLYTKWCQPRGMVMASPGPSQAYRSARLPMSTTPWAPARWPAPPPPKLSGARSASPQSTAFRAVASEADRPPPESGARATTNFCPRRTSTALCTPSVWSQVREPGDPMKRVQLTSRPKDVGHGESLRHWRRSAGGTGTLRMYGRTSRPWLAKAFRQDAAANHRANVHFTEDVGVPNSSTKSTSRSWPSKCCAREVLIQRSSSRLAAARSWRADESLGSSRKRRLDADPMAPDLSTHTLR
mmetsp:Transcript_19380/g.60797  ORF Transcript_19380/g.60797 Transcript_19380/m.60797 type:complete len:287 (+) Transcript_19380:1158-2018(+)